MKVQQLITLLLVVLLPFLANGEETAPQTTKIGDPIVLELTGPPAAAYLKLCGQPVPGPDCDYCIPLDAHVKEAVNNSLVVTAYVHKTKPEPQLITVTASVTQDNIVNAA